MQLMAVCVALRNSKQEDSVSNNSSAVYEYLAVRTLMAKLRLMFGNVATADRDVPSSRRVRWTNCFFITELQLGHNASKCASTACIPGRELDFTPI